MKCKTTPLGNGHHSAAKNRREKTAKKTYKFNCYIGGNKSTFSVSVPSAAVVAELKELDRQKRVLDKFHCDVLEGLPKFHA
jgi:hypothetical protein